MVGETLGTQTARAAPPASADRAIAHWLLAVCALIFVMVVLGGVTRLTQSGLSMVEWRPLMGVLPPMSEAEALETAHAHGDARLVYELSVEGSADGAGSLAAALAASPLLREAVPGESGEVRVYVLGARPDPHDPGGETAGERPVPQLRDVRDGVVSRDAAERIYGVALSDDGRTVDAEATARLRSA